MRLIVFGKNGQVGWELQRTLAPLGEVVALGKEDVDLADYGLLRQVISKLQPQVIVNAAAYNDVDKAEEEQDLAMAINAIAPGVMAEEAKAKGATLIHFSTDYVFDGEHGKPYSEDDTTRPLNIYGQSKLKGEQAIERVQGIYLIFRTGWVYSFRKGSFPVKVLRWARSQKVIRVVEDQVGSPTWCRMLAETTARVLAMAAKKDSSWLNHRSGLYHLTGKGTISRFEWAKAVLSLDPRKEEQVVKKLKPARTAEFPTAARRPVYSALCCERFESVFEMHLPHWEDSLKLAMAT